MAIIKVDRVADIREAVALEAAGATIIGVNLAPDPRCEKRGFVSPSLAREIAGALGAARLCVILDPDAADPDEAIATARDLKPVLLQVPRYGAAQSCWRDKILAAGLPVVLDGEEISYEDDPNLVPFSLDKAVSWGAPLIQLDLLNDYPNPWRFIQEEAPKEPEELIQVDELRHIIDSYPVLISMAITPDEAASFVGSFPTAAGIFFRLSSSDIGPTAKVVSAVRAVLQEAASG